MKKIYLLSKIPLQFISGIKEKEILQLSKLKIKNLRDLLFHLPIRYENYSKICPIKKIKVGMITSVKGEIIKSTIDFKKKMYFYLI